MTCWVAAVVGVAVVLIVVLFVLGIRCLDRYLDRKFGGQGEDFP